MQVVKHRRSNAAPVEEAAALYDLIYAGIAQSKVYREALKGLDLPEWLVPLSAVNRTDLERIAAALDITPGDAFVDLACGLGGPGLWVAGKTGASLTGVDISKAATERARLLANRLGLDRRANFVTADATASGLAAHRFAALMTVDSIQFMNPAAAAAEIARLLRPGGRAAILTWEALTDVEIPTIVRDYRPILEEAGLTICAHEILPDARGREMRQMRALNDRADELRAEIGESAEPILHEAADRVAREHQPPRVRKVFIVAQA